MLQWRDTLPNCDVCGRFVAARPGASWSQQWHQDMGGFPCLDDPKWRCIDCTTTHGVGDTNCALSYGGNGIIRATEEASK